MSMSESKYKAYAQGALDKLKKVEALKDPDDRKLGCLKWNRKYANHRINETSAKDFIESGTSADDIEAIRYKGDREAAINRGYLILGTGSGQAVLVVAAAIDESGNESDDLRPVVVYIRPLLTAKGGKLLTLDKPAQFVTRGSLEILNDEQTVYDILQLKALGTYLKDSKTYTPGKLIYVDRGVERGDLGGEKWENANYSVFGMIVARIEETRPNGKNILRAVVVQTLLRNGMLQANVRGQPTAFDVVQVAFERVTVADYSRQTRSGQINAFDANFSALDADLKSELRYQKYVAASDENDKVETVEGPITTINFTKNDGRNVLVAEQQGGKMWNLLKEGDSPITDVSKISPVFYIGKPEPETLEKYLLDARLGLPIVDKEKLGPARNKLYKLLAARKPNENLVTVDNDTEKEHLRKKALNAIAALDLIPALFWSGGAVAQTDDQVVEEEAQDVEDQKDGAQVVEDQEVEAQKDEAQVVEDQKDGAQDGQGSEPTGGDNSALANAAAESRKTIAKLEIKLANTVSELEAARESAEGLIAAKATIEVLRGQLEECKQEAKTEKAKFDRQNAILSQARKNVTDLETAYNEVEESSKAFNKDATDVTKRELDAAVKNLLGKIEVLQGVLATQEGTAATTSETSARRIGANGAASSLVEVPYDDTTGAFTLPPTREYDVLSSAPASRAIEISFSSTRRSGAISSITLVGVPARTVPRDSGVLEPQTYNVFYAVWRDGGDVQPAGSFFQPVGLANASPTTRGFVDLPVAGAVTIKTSNGLRHPTLSYNLTAHSLDAAASPMVDLVENSSANGRAKLRLRVQRLDTGTYTLLHAVYLVHDLAM